MRFNNIFPCLFTIFDKPLVYEGNYAFIPTSGHNFVFRFIIYGCLVGINHILSDFILSFRYLDASVIPNAKNSEIESLFVSYVFGLIKLFDVFL